MLPTAGDLTAASLSRHSS